MTDMPRPPLTPETPVQYAHGVGPARAKILVEMGLITCGDLLTYYPRDYIQHQGQLPISQIRPGDVATLVGDVIQTRMIRRQKGRFEALITDSSGGNDRAMLTWFHPYGVSSKVGPGMKIRITGKATMFSGRLQFVNPKWDLLKEEEDRPPVHAHIEPVYPASADLSSPQIAKLIQSAASPLLPHVQEWFAEAYLAERGFYTRREATERIHRPLSMADVKKARRTLAYHEFFLHQLAMAIKRYHQRTSQPALPLRVDDAVDRRIRALVEFPLTASQNRVVEQIKKDLTGTRPMNRLLQGDVGSGKTVVALYAMLCAAATGHQAALMAPTEILAEQHYLTLQKYLKNSRLRIDLLLGGQNLDERAGVLSRLAEGETGLVVGTHALLSESVKFKSLALIIIDEQHKFGVEHRSILRQRHGAPHTLVMTATPIPRTLAMTAFGDLDVSVIDELPPGRTPISTRMVTAERREDVYAFVAKRLAEGEQAYVVTPTIDQNDMPLLDSDQYAQINSQAALRSVTATQEELQKTWLKDYRVGLLHGRMDRDTRANIMERFRAKKLDVLVATTVIEVGVDVPNATMMVIEHADRFGLSQLHQLRGRVGRGKLKSYCILISDQTTEDGIARMQTMVRYSSGFKVAEEDLRLRGFGQLIGTQQSGRSDFQFPEFLFDPEFLGMARRDAFNTVAADPRLLAADHITLRNMALSRFGDMISLADVG